MTPKLKKVTRLDSMPISKASFTKEGYLLDKPILTSTGIFEYANADGSIRRELRIPEEVFDPESLKSYKAKPVIITHDAGLIDKDNVSEEQIGTIMSDGYQDGSDVRAEIIIHDTDSMRRCGLKELSLGYNLELDETPGVWDGKPYDAIQRNIRINHLALVREARAGEQARLNIDSRDNKNLEGGKKMATKPTKKSSRGDGVLSTEELEKAIEAYKARRGAVEKADEDVEKEEKVVDSPKPVTDAPEIDEDSPVEYKLAVIKDRKNERDETGEPQTNGEAMKVISNQDEDIDALFDIIDTLLAERDFKGTAETDGCCKKDAEEVPAEEALVEENADEEEGNGGEAAKETPVALVEDEAAEETPADEDKLNTDSIDRIVRQRVKLGMIGRTLNMDGLEDMPLAKAKMAVIKAVKPGLRLDGKSNAYINAAFDCACDEIKASGKKDTNYQKKQMFNKDGNTMKASGAAAARQRMIDRQNKKEDK